MPSPALGQYLFELHETGDYQLSVRGLELRRGHQRDRGGDLRRVTPSLGHLVSGRLTEGTEISGLNGLKICHLCL